MADETFTTRTERIIGESGLAALADSRVMVLGLGGVGSNCAEALARAGIGHFVLLDRDVVAPSNINRQAVAFQSTVGEKKVDVMERIIADINPDAEVVKLDRFVREEDVPALLDEFGGACDYIVDAIDTISTKLAIAQAADERGLPLISAMGAGNKLFPEQLRCADIYKTENCRMARIMRKECRRRGVRKLEVVYSAEEAKRATSVDRSERDGLGTMPYLPSIMGQMIAGRVICRLAGVEGV